MQSGPAGSGVSRACSSRCKSSTNGALEKKFSLVDLLIQI